MIITQTKQGRREETLHTDSSRGSASVESPSEQLVWSSGHAPHFRALTGSQGLDGYSKTQMNRLPRTTGSRPALQEDVETSSYKARVNFSNQFKLLPPIYSLFFFITSKESDFSDLKEGSLSRFFTLEYFHSQTKKYLRTWKLSLPNNNQLETRLEFKAGNTTTSLITVDLNNSFLLSQESTLTGILSWSI